MKRWCLKGVGVWVRVSGRRHLSELGQLLPSVTASAVPQGDRAVRGLKESCCPLQLLKEPMNPVHGWVLWALENNFLTKCASQFLASTPNIQDRNKYPSNPTTTKI